MSWIDWKRAHLVNLTVETTVSAVENTEVFLFSLEQILAKKSEAYTFIEIQ